MLGIKDIFGSGLCGTGWPSLISVEFMTLSTPPLCCRILASPEGVSVSVYILKFDSATTVKGSL